MGLSGGRGGGFLGPLFIMSVALRVTFSPFITHAWFILAIFCAAFFGKIIGVYIGGLVSKLSHEESLCMGFGMNGRGELELIIALIGIELGIITNIHLSILVFVAFATTLLAPIPLPYLLKKFKIKTVK